MCVLCFFHVSFDTAAFFCFGDKVKHCEVVDNISVIFVSLQSHFVVVKTFLWTDTKSASFSDSVFEKISNK